MALQRGLIKARTVGEEGRIDAVALAILGQAVAQQTQTAARFMQQDVAGGDIPIGWWWARVWDRGRRRLRQWRRI